MLQVTNTEAVEFDPTTCKFMIEGVFEDSDWSCSLADGKTNHLQIMINKKIDLTKIDNSYLIELGLEFQVDIKNPDYNLPNSYLDIEPYIRAANSQKIIAAYNATISL